MGDPSKLDGVFVGHVEGESAAVNIEIEVDGRAARWRVGGLGRTDQSTVESGDRKVRYFQKEVLRRVQAEAARERRRTIAPNFKPGSTKQRKPVPVTCPDCGGYRSFDCDTCEGAGVVPG